MQLPTAEDINSTRLARFDDAITEAPSAGDIDFYRDVVAHYVNEHDVPERDVAAAWPSFCRATLPYWSSQSLSDRRSVSALLAKKAPRRERGRSDVPMATYRINVGRRHKVEPRQIVGALANEGGLRRGTSGTSTSAWITPLVELPAQLPPDAWKKLRKT